jgi:hypothetical protein
MRLAGCVVAALALAAPVAARAQTSGTTLGFELGFSEAGFVGGAGGLNESRQGTLFGVFLDRHIAGPIDGEAALFFAKKGGGLSVGLQDVPIRISAQLVYLELPLLARIRLPVGRFPIRPVAFGGGSVNFNIGCEFQAEVAGEIGQVPCRDTTGAGGGVALRTIDFGAIVGGGIEYGWRSSAIRLEFREHFGLRPILADDPTKNRTWAILLGLTI